MKLENATELYFLNLMFITDFMKAGLTQLPYETDSLEPNISRMTIEYHHGMYLQACLRNLGELTSGTKFENLDLETIMKSAEGPMLNNALQVWNHTFYFESLRPAGNSELKGSLADALIESFGSLELFRECFIKASMSLFGSGWVWIILNPAGVIEVLQERNAGNPLRRGLIPLLGCDLWEHSYYLDYQHRRYDYLNSFWSVINWDIIEERFLYAKGMKLGNTFLS